MSRYVGLHSLPGFTREMLAGVAPALESLETPRFLKAYTGFREGKVVCEWESPGKPEIVQAYKDLGFPYDEIFQVEAICVAGDDGRTTTDSV
jgi:hypothetical protein